MRTRKILAGAGFLAIAAGTMDAAAAQTLGATAAAAAKPSKPTFRLEEIVVTAERRTSTAQKTPLTVTVLSGAELQRTAVNTYQDALKSVSGVEVQGISNGDTNTPTIAIRGLGTDGGSRTQATAVYVDGVIVNNASLQFYDLSRIEVLSGPQATLYGGVATAGAVNIITNAPSFSGYSGQLQFGVGNYGQVTEQAMVNAPITDKLAIRVAVDGQDRNNYYGSSGDGRDEVNGRLKVLYKPNDDVSITLGTEIYHFSGAIIDALAPQTPNGSIEKPIPLIGYGHIEDEKVFATYKQDFGWANLTYIPSLQLSDTYVTSQGVPNVGKFVTYSNTTPYQNQTTQEVRLASEPGSTINWVTGMYYERTWEEKTNREEQDGSFPVQKDAPVKFYQTINITQYHPFAQGTVKLLPHVRFTGGVSYSSYEINYPQTITFPSGPPTFTSTNKYLYDVTFHSVDGVARLEADVGPQNLVYASFSTGFRPGGPGGGPPSSFYGKETVQAYEIGSKNRFFSNLLQVNGDFYFDNFPAFQNQTNEILGDGAIVQGVSTIPAHLFGVETSIVAAVTPMDVVSLRAAYEHARYTGNYLNGGEVVQTNGAQLTHAPDWDINGQYDHTVVFPNESKLLTDVSFHYQSKQPVSFDACTFTTAFCTSESSPFVGNFYQPQFQQPAYVLLDASATYTLPNDKYSVTFYGRNLLNKTYETNSTFGFANLGIPRTYGFLLSAKF